MGRLSKYTPELAAEICELLAEGKSLRSICEAEYMPSEGTVREWAHSNAEFSTHYAHARQKGLDALADEMLAVAYTPEVGVIETDKVDRHGDEYTEVQRADMVAHRRLKVDTLKWYLSKLAPKRYGDRIEVEHKGQLSIVERLAAGRKRTGSV